MAIQFDENLQFVLLIEEHREVLEKSQLPSLRKKKDDALSQFGEKWAQKSGKTLTHPALMKKINNLKQRAKSAFAKANPLSTWQSKILEMTKEKDDDAEDDELRIATSSIETADEPSGRNVNGGSSKTPQTESSDMLKQLESDQSQNLTNEQLHRVVLLRQIKILELQQQKLERDISNADTPVLFDISSLNVSNILNPNSAG